MRATGRPRATRGAVIGLLAGVMVAAAIGPQASATFSGRRGRIAYAGVPKGSDTPEIFSRKKDGTGVRRLTQSRYWDSDPVWSASGRHIAWSCRGRTVKSDPTFTSDLCVMDADGRNERRFGFKVSVKTPDFSPSGKRIGYATDGANERTEEGRRRYPKDEVWVMNRDGSNRTRITRNRLSEAAVSWSPAGAEIAFIGVDPRGRAGLYVVELKTRDQRLLTRGVTVGSSANGHGTLFTGELDWSPDGSWIAFNRRVDDATDVYVIDAAGEEEVRVTDDPVSELNTSPAWAPDGKAIVYRHSGEGSSGPGWTCLVAFPLEDGPVSTDHDDCRYSRVSEFDFSWQARS